MLAKRILTNEPLILIPVFKYGKRNDIYKELFYRMSSGKTYLCSATTIIKMKFIETRIKDLWIIEPTVFGDERGYFYESFHQEKFEKAIGRSATFVQDNQSKSGKDIVRGLHFQVPPFAQGKLVRVLAGKVIDVAVDIRKHSPTYGQHVSVELSGENKRMFWVPEGFAHGFSSIEEDTIFVYKCTNYYHKESEGSILWNDKDLGINWEVSLPIVSEKDQKGTEFCNFVSPF